MNVIEAVVVAIACILIPLLLVRIFVVLALGVHTLWRTYREHTGSSNDRISGGGHNHVGVLPFCRRPCGNRRGDEKWK